MISNVRFLVLTSLLWFGVRSTAFAGKCYTPSGSLVAGQVWLYVQLVDAKTGAVIDTALGRVASRTTEKEEYRSVKPNKSCFVPSVPKDATDVMLQVNAMGYVNKLCPPGKTWPTYSNPDSPYDCRLIPKPGSLADAGVFKIGDLKDEKARKDAIVEAVEFAMHFEPSERTDVLQRISEKIDVRPGLLAQEILNRQGLKNCAGSSCIEKLPNSLDKETRDYLTVNSNSIDAELFRVTKKITFGNVIKNSKLKTPLIILFDDPSHDAEFHVGSDNAAFKLYVRQRFPDSADKIGIIVDAKFDPAVAQRNLAKMGVDM